MKRQRMYHSFMFWLGKLVEADAVFFLLPPLMVVLVAGAVAQRWVGLYGAYRMFFGSFFLWVGPVPLPGGTLLIGALALGLCLKFILKSQWQWNKSGIILTHLGALILLIGGGVTALCAQESYMLIPEGATTSYMYDYNARALVVYEDERMMARFPYEEIAQWESGALPFSLHVLGWCENCSVIKRQEAQDYDPKAAYRGMAVNMALQSKPPEKEPEANLTGLTLLLGDVSEKTDGVYVAFDGMPAPVTFTKNGKTYRLIFGKAQRQLPFSITLQDFQKQTYGGTDKARSYASEILVRDQGAEWPVRIEMNKPFRYRGYTFFQSSFEEGDDYEATVLAVVENKGRLFPYIGTGVIGVGLTLHLVTLWLNRRQKRKTA